MAVLFDADVPVHYGFINLFGADDEDQADLMELTSFQDSFELRLPAVRSLRARYCASGMEAARGADSVMDEEPTVDRYLLQLWPAAPAPDAVVRLTSDIAAYWHGEARAIAPRQPG